VGIKTALLAGYSTVRGGFGSSVASDRKLFGQNVAVKANAKSGKNNSEIITDLYEELFASAHDRLER
jgi:outer membrane protein assembly factor BamA